MNDHGPTEAIITTEWGQLRVPHRLLGTWGRYGWPTDDVLQRMVEAGTVEAAAPLRPRRPTPAVAYMVALNHVRSDKIGEACHILERMTPAELVLFGAQVDQLRALITERTT